MEFTNVNFANAKNDLLVAQRNFDAADSKHIDVAIHNLNAAEIRFGIVLNELKGVKGNE